MNRLTEKRLHDEDVLKLMHVLKYEKQPIELVGSASLKNMRYYGDFDFITNVPKSNAKQAFDVLSGIIEHINKNPNYYLIELKLQLENGTKKKYFAPITLKYDDFKKAFTALDFVKLDLVAFLRGRFMEASVIYKFSSNHLTTEEYIQSLEGDIRAFKKEKKYYKVVKRMFNIHRARGQSEKMHTTMNFLNDEAFGKLYSIKSLLEAMHLMEEHYKADKLVQAKLKESSKQLKPYSPMDESKIASALNKAARAFIVQQQ